MRVLCTNDDGIDAPGLACLHEALCSRFDEVVVLAPDRQWSQCSHSIITDHALVWKEIGPNRNSLSGSPADCVRVGLLQRGPFDLVCSGVNSGGNLGVDIHYSGTVAAAREAMFHGIPSMAFSMVLEREVEADWDVASQIVGTGIDKWLQGPRQPEIWNFNLPARWNKDDIRDCQPDPNPLPLAFKKTEDGSQSNMLLT